MPKNEPECEIIPEEQQSMRDIIEEKEKQHKIDDMTKKLEAIKSINDATIAEKNNERLMLNPYFVAGYLHAYFCSALDRGEDPRKIPVPQIIDKLKQLTGEK